MKEIGILRDTELPGVLWMPEGPCRLVLQVVHGMTEHMGRYENFAEILTAAGIAVAGFDLPGHGKNPGDPRCASMGELGWAGSLDQIAAMNRALTKKLPGVPRAILGFSLGSFLVRDYVSTRKDDLCGIILMGSGDQPGFVLELLKSLVRGQIRRAGFDSSTPLVHQLSFGAYNGKFRPNRTEADWLCADEEELDGYLADPLCRRTISSGLFWQLLDAMQRTGADPYESWDPDTPVLLLSGAEDPVGSAGKGMRTVEKKMKAGGLRQVTLTLIPGARHDLLHERACGGAQAAEKAILAFLDACIRQQP